MAEKPGYSLPVGDAITAGSIHAAVSAARQNPLASCLLRPVTQDGAPTDIVEAVNPRAAETRRPGDGLDVVGGEDRPPERSAADGAALQGEPAGGRGDARAGNLDHDPSVGPDRLTSVVKR